MALEAQLRPKRSPERAPTEGEARLEAEEAGRAAGREPNDDDEDERGQQFEDDAPPRRQSERREASDNLDEVGKEAVALEKRARKLGWKPESEWTGDPAKWVDAEAWIERVMANRPLAEDRFKKLEEQNDALTAAVAESNRRLAETGQVINDLYKGQKTIRQREYDRARQDLLAEQRAAVEEGDVARYDAASGKIKDLDSEAETAAPAREEPRREEAARQGQQNPVVTKWLAANPWFNADAHLHNVADSYHQQLLRERPTLSLGENLAAVREEMLRLYPDKFPGERAEDEEDEPRRASAVHRPTGNAGRRDRGSGKRGIKDLPPDDRKVFERYQRTIPGYTAEEFLASYIWEDQDQRR